MVPNLGHADSSWFPTLGMQTNRYWLLISKHPMLQQKETAPVQAADHLLERLAAGAVHVADTDAAPREVHGHPPVVQLPLPIQLPEGLLLTKGLLIGFRVSPSIFTKRGRAC